MSDKNHHDQTIEIEPNRETIGQRVTLRVTHGPHAPRQWVFDRTTTVTIGRNAPSNLRLGKELALSKTHCELRIEPPHVHLIDLSSTNGTLVNEVPMAEAELHHGDVFGIGETRIIVECDEASSAAPLLVSPISPIGQKVDSHDTTKPSPSDQEPPETLAFSHSGIQQAAKPTTMARTMGVYDVIEKLGEGGMATVYRGKHRKSGEEVAIKVVKGAGVTSEKMLQLFVREASVLSQLRHLRIVRCLEFGLHEQQPYIVMELIPVIDLLAIVDKQSPEKRIKTACWVASRVLRALDYAHSQGIVHRDVKPGNILAYRESRRLQVKLCDFGLAKCFEDAGFSAMTDDLSVRGTIAYMAPEQLRDARAARPLVDIFATGACLYRLLVGKHPTLTSHGAAFSKADFVGADLPPKLAEIVAKAMHHNAEKRFNDANEFEHALREFHGT